MPSKWVDGWTKEGKMPRILALQSLPVSGNPPADYYAESTLSEWFCSTFSVGCE